MMVKRYCVTFYINNSTIDRLDFGLVEFSVLKAKLNEWKMIAVFKVLIATVSTVINGLTSK